MGERWFRGNEHTYKGILKSVLSAATLSWASIGVAKTWGGEAGAERRKKKKKSRDWSVFEAMKRVEGKVVRGSRSERIGKKIKERNVFEGKSLVGGGGRRERGGRGKRKRVIRGYLSKTPFGVEPRMWICGQPRQLNKKNSKNRKRGCTLSLGGYDFLPGE